MSKSKTKGKAMDPRVRIARDVLARLDAKKFKASTGVFLESKLTKAQQKNLDVDARGVLKTKICVGCARGALFLARLDRQNSLQLAEIATEGDGTYDDDFNYCPGPMMVGVNRPQTSEYLKEFSEDQLRLIETAFEVCNTFEAPQATAQAAVDFGAGYERDSARLRAICRNIIKNKGEFRPQDEV